MKYGYHLLTVLLLLSLTGCQPKVTLDNAQNAESPYQYSKVTAFGGFKELAGDQFVVNQAKEFTNALISVQMNRSYKKMNVSDESILYSDYYKEKMGQALDAASASLNEFYQRYQIITELVGITYRKVIIIGDDAFLNIQVKNMLTSCISNDIAKQIGYTSGLNDTATSEFNVKLVYVKGEYLIYDLERINTDGLQLAFTDYASRISVPEQVILPEVSSSVPKESAAPEKTKTPENNQGQTNPEVNQEEKNKKEVGDFINRLAALQNNRNYETLKGNEDYVLLSDEYIAKLNKNQDDVEATKKAYQRYQLTTELTGVRIKSIEKKGDAYVVNVDIESRILRCISQEVAKAMGYTGGIGSTGVTKFNYTVKNINGAWKLIDSKELK